MNLEDRTVGRFDYFYIKPSYTTNITKENNGLIRENHYKIHLSYLSLLKSLQSHLNYHLT